MNILLYKDELIDAYTTAIRRSKEISLIVPLASVAGVKLLQPSVETHLANGGTVRVLLGLDMFTSPDAIQLLLQIKAQYPKQFSLKRFVAAPNAILHAKVALFEADGEDSAIIGSSNLTQGGFSRNFEASVFTTERTAIESLLKYFEQLFLGGRAHPVDHEWLETYRKWWTRAKKVVARQRQLQRDLRSRGKKAANPHTLYRIFGKRIAFTGLIPDWPRNRKLYPKIRELGGEVAERANAMAYADALIQGDILGRESTRKLEIARERNIPVLSQDEFLPLLDPQTKTRQGKGSNRSDR